jgi:DNA repair photolyase
MRHLLAGLAAHRGLRILITTKSDLVARDGDLLRELARWNTVRIVMTVTTMDAGLARRTEPYAPRPDLRMEAMAALASQGLATGVAASPVLPWLTDGEGSLDAVARAARAAGAATFHARPLFLRDSAWAVFLPWLEREFPALAPRYRSRYTRGAHVDRLYGEWLAERVERVRTRHGLTARAEAPAPAPPLQLPLFS